jgi:hypothetical protein
MAQIFDKGTLLALKLGVLLAIAVLVTLVLLWRWDVDYPNATLEPVNQPVPFSHKHHVNDDGIDCRYCHSSVETAASAGMPASEVCMNCHSQLFKNAPVLAPVRDSIVHNRPLQWVRVHDLPGFVYFDHSVHVTHGVPCQACHGRIDTMALTSRVHSLDMQWCLDCHRHPQQRLVAPNKVFTMQAVNTDNQHEVAKQYVLPTTMRLTDCSSCHR